MSARGAIPVALLVALLLAPSPASACGGFFCNATQPVVQSGEQVVWALEDDGSLVMSVRIVYQGAAPEFAWILPVPVVPTIELGTAALFDALEPPMRPTFDTTVRVDGTCARDPMCVYEHARGAVQDAGAIFLADASSGGGPTVYLSETLGPYETVVLGASTGAEVADWLTTHGYAIAPDAGPLLDAYLSSGHVVVALRLRNDASTSEIQPVTLRMPSTAPCLPIRLTAIATQPDLPITGFFLASARVTSSNYSMLDLTFRDPGLWTGATSYTSMVTRAADAAGGRAFATDYAGATPSIAITLPSVLDLADLTDPTMVLQALRARGYTGDAQLLALLSRFIVPPVGTMPRDYFNCAFNGFGVCGAPQSFDPAGLAAAIDQTITQPRAAAQALVEEHGYLTRLFTTMSKEEMTLDPEFRVDAALHDVSNVHTAVRVLECDPGHYASEAGVHLELPDGTVMSVSSPMEHRSPVAYCAAYGLVPALTPAGGGGCAVGRSSGGAALLGGLALVALAIRRRLRYKAA